MNSLTLIVPGRLDTLTGGYEYDRRMVTGLGDLGWTVTVHELDVSFPRPTAAALEQAASVLAHIADGSVVLIDGLAFGAMPVEAEREAKRLRLVAIVHHPLAEETGVDPRVAAELAVSERRALAVVRRVIVTSRATATMLGKYGVEPDRISVIEPGTDPAPLARGSHSPTVHLLSVATLVPRKGHEILMVALGTLGDLDWRLTCVGSLERDTATVERVQAQLVASGISDRVRLAGEAGGSALSAHYDSADVFVLPTFYEGFGMAVANAVARGLPVVSTATGAISELVGLDAGLLVPPGDPRALADALRRVIRDPDLRGRLAKGAERVRVRLSTWEDQARKLADVLAELAPPGNLATFAADWLSLRELTDAAARSWRLAQAIARRLSVIDPIRIVDLAAGTGANTRYLADYFAPRQEWLLVDHDPYLLDCAARMMPSFSSRGGGRAETRQVDLRIISGGGGADLFAGRDLVTASALLDLVSDTWLLALAERCRANGAAVLFALSYDGRIQFTPQEPEDERVRELVNRHQQTDKGFGPALGPDAVSRAEQHFTALGYVAQHEQSDWILTPETQALQRSLIEGWAGAAAAVEPGEAVSIRNWCARRLAHVDAGRSRIVVGHQDMAAWPA